MGSRVGFSQQIPEATSARTFGILTGTRGSVGRGFLDLRVFNRDMHILQLRVSSPLLLFSLFDLLDGCTCELLSEHPFDDLLLPCPMIADGDQHAACDIDSDGAAKNNCC